MNRRKSLRLLASTPLLSAFPATAWEAWWQSLNKRAIPSSGEQLAMVGLGTWQTFDVGQANADRAPLQEVLKQLVSKGGMVVDSSPMYGRSEQVVGDLAQASALQDQLFMATKVWTTSRQSGISQMNRSMSRMQKRPMDLMQIHNLQDWKTHMKTLQQWKEEGKLRYIGITHYLESAYSRMESIMKEYPLDFIQLNYSIASRKAENRLLPQARERGIAVLTNRPYEGGSLFRQVKGKSLPSLAKDIGAESWGQFFLKYILSNDAVTCAIPGTSKVKHLLDNLGAAEGQLPNELQRTKMKQIIGF